MYICIKHQNMRAFFILLIVAFACTAPQSEYVSHGEEITPADAISVADLIGQVNEENQPFKVEAKIGEVCQKKGCWMTLKTEEGVNIRVTFKDYGFFVPKDAGGQKVIIEGVALKETVEEDVAKHYAEDEGVEYDESMRDAITFVAHGVLIKSS